jgi:serine/threonine protein kinase
MSSESEASQPLFQAPTLEEMAYYLPQYEMHGFIAQGGMGAVYLGRQASLDRFVAIKVLPPTFGGEMDFAARFQIEARAMAKLQHGNIVGVFDFGTTRVGHLYLVMEYVDGSTLHDLIHTGHVTKEHALSFALQLCDAIQFAHDHGIIHRDIKPNNVLINKEGRVKVADFGLARPAAAHEHEVMMGTPDYAAPEITTGVPVDHRADIFAMGVVFYEMLTRTVPKKGRQPASTLCDCDPAWDEVIVKSTRVLTKDRYQQVKEIRQALSLLANRRRYASGGGAAPQRQPAGPELVDDSAGTPMLAVMLKGMIALALGLTALYFWSNRKPTLDHLVVDPPSQSSSSPAESPQPPPQATHPVSPSEGVPVLNRPLRPVEVANVPPGHLSTFQQGHTGVIMDVRVLPDQMRALTVSDDGTLKLWVIATGECLWTREKATNGTAGLDLSSDGKMVATAGKKGVVSIWEVDTAKLLHTTTLETRLLTTAAKFAPDAKSLIVACTPGQTGPAIWHFSEDGRVENLVGWTSGINSIAVLPDVSSLRFITAGGGGKGKDDAADTVLPQEIILAQLGEQLTLKPFPPPKTMPGRLAISADGRRMAVVWGNDVSIYDVESQQLISNVRVRTATFSLRFLNAGRHLLMGVQDGTLRIANVGDGKEVWRGTSDTHSTNRVAVSADETFALTGGGAGSDRQPDGDFALHLWRLPPATDLPFTEPSLPAMQPAPENIDIADPELAKLKDQFQLAWKEKVESLGGSAREDLDAKYTAALRTKLQSALPSQRDAFLTEISRVANKGALPTVNPVDPAPLQQLMKIYLQQIALLEQKPRDAALALLKEQAAQANTLTEARTQAGDVKGAARARKFWESWEKDHIFK